ncbi:hypothetical protein F4810DRAFT_716736 [Camillea tinctor]|nr:hypothetical protein F4810DRAFT_716736 [Camillea tinctor]
MRQKGSHNDIATLQPNWCIFTYLTAVEAGFISPRAFHRYRKTILTQVSRNGIEREALNDAVAAALCPRA